MTTIVMKEHLDHMLNERLANKTSIELLLSVILKYGMAPIACIYLGYVVMEKDKTIENSHRSLVDLIEKQTVATTKNTEVLNGLIKVVESNNRRFDRSEKMQ